MVRFIQILSQKSNLICTAFLGRRIGNKNYGLAQILPARLPCFSIILVLFSLLNGCAIRKLAVNSMANGLADSGTGVYASDEDPELVGDALPFALKTMEGVLQATPKHKRLLIATASGFVQYAYAYVLWPAQSLENTNLTAVRMARARAKRLFLRARVYGLRALELRFTDINKHLSQNRNKTLAVFKPEDVAALYWTGVAWGSAISVSKDEMALIGDVPIVRALLERALVLDERWNDGAIHEFFLVFEASLSAAQGGDITKAEMHFKRAMELNNGSSIGPLVSLAETVCVRQQDRKRFKKLLTQTLEFDVDHFPEKRLANILAQRRASELLSRIDQLFFVEEKENHKNSKHSNETVEIKENLL